MAKNQPLRKNPAMPPKAPRLPKSPVGFNYRQKPIPEKPFSCLCEGGPWHGTKISMFKSSPATNYFRLGKHHGRYVMISQFEGEHCAAHWEAA